MADVVLSQRVDDAGLAGRVTVTSCGTGDWHVGQPMDERAAATLRATRLRPVGHRAQQFSASWLADNDLVLAMDAANLAEVRRVAARAEVQPGRTGSGSSVTSTPSNRVVRCRTRTTVGRKDSRRCSTMVERTCSVLVSALQQLPDLHDPPSQQAEPAT